jgi:hypothetical protein
MKKNKEYCPWTEFPEKISEYKNISIVVEGYSLNTQRWRRAYYNFEHDSWVDEEYKIPLNILKWKYLK